MRVWLVFLLLLPLGASGCMSGFGLEAPPAFVIEHSMDGGLTWSGQYMEKLHQGHVTKTNVSLPPEGGGGRTYELDWSHETVEIQFRIKDADQFFRFRATWVLRDSGDHGDVSRFEVAPGEIVRRTVGRIADVQADVTLARGLELETRTERAFVRVVSQWTVESEIFPIRHRDEAKPDNYDEMSDAFRLPAVEDQSIRVNVFTKYRGTFNASTNGTDIDVALVHPQGSSYCTGRGGVGIEGPHPAQANETLISPYAIYRQNPLTVYIGALGIGCGNNWVYENRHPVPYSAEILLTTSRRQ
jgi:hypothetical protein